MNSPLALRSAFLIALTALSLCVGSAQAASLSIVAIGTSNTYGKGVARAQTYPAQLQDMLNAKGIDARIENAGVNGDTSADILSRLDSAVPDGTRLVLIEVHANNDMRGGVSGQTSANVTAIKARLRARGIRFIDISGAMSKYVMAGRSSPLKLADGRHLNEEGYALVAKTLLPQVISTIRAR